MRRILLSLVSALAIISAAPAAQAQTAGALLAGLSRPGGVVAVGTPVNYSWTAPTGMYFVTATVSYALQSTRTDTGGGAAAIRCNVHRGAGAIDISVASVGAGPTSANNVSGEMTLSGRLSVTEASATVTVTCQNVGNARSSVRVDHLQLHLVPVGGFRNLDVAP
jgi:hypothetical protein